MATSMQSRHLNKPPTARYEDEDDCGSADRFYEPMLRYLEANRRFGKPQSPLKSRSIERTPLSQTLSARNTSKSTVSLGTQSVEHKRYASVGERYRERELNEYKQVKRALPFPVHTAPVRRSQIIDQPVHLPTIEEKILRNQLERQDKRRISNIMGDIERSKLRFSADKDVPLSKGLRAAIRGKTASQITAALIADSEKNIKNTRVEVTQRSTRGQSENRIVKRTTHIEYMDDRMLDQLDSSMSSSLHGVKQQLSSFNQRSEDLYHNSRLRNVYFSE